MAGKEVKDMSPETREYLSQYAREEVAKKVAVKKVENYPKNWGPSNNRKMSLNGSWRK